MKLFKVKDYSKSSTAEFYAVAESIEHVAKKYSNAHQITEIKGNVDIIKN